MFEEILIIDYGYIQKQGYFDIIFKYFVNSILAFCALLLICYLFKVVILFIYFLLQFIASLFRKIKRLFIEGNCNKPNSKCCKNLGEKIKRFFYYNYMYFCGENQKLITIFLILTYIAYFTSFILIIFAFLYNWGIQVTSINYIIFYQTHLFMEIYSALFYYGHYYFWVFGVTWILYLLCNFNFSLYVYLAHEKDDEFTDKAQMIFHLIHIAFLFIIYLIAFINILSNDLKEDNFNIFIKEKAKFVDISPEIIKNDKKHYDLIHLNYKKLVFKSNCFSSQNTDMLVEIKNRYNFPSIKKLLYGIITIGFFIEFLFVFFRILKYINGDSEEEIRYDISQYTSILHNIAIILISSMIFIKLRINKMKFYLDES